MKAVNYSHIYDASDDMQWYYSLLSRLTSSLDVWSTTYVHVLSGAHPVVQFTRETGLKPNLVALGGDGAADAVAFENRYKELCSEKYPRDINGNVLFPFTRMFLVAKRR